MSDSPPTSPPDRSAPPTGPTPGPQPAHPSRAARPHPSVWGIVDGTVLLATWGYVVWLLALYLSLPAASGPPIPFIAGLYLLPVFIAAWMLVRVLSLAGPLLHLSWRMQLAVTPVDPAKYLWQRLRASFFWFLVALPLAHLTLVLIVVVRECGGPGPSTKNVLQIALGLTMFASVFCVPVAGVFDQMRRQCTRGGAYSPLGTILWTILSIGVPIGAFAGLLTLHNHLLGAKPRAIGFYIITTQGTLCIAALIYARQCWKRTCRTYFVFETNPTLAVPGEAAGAEERE